jgi:hypothetical protein
VWLCNLLVILKNGGFTLLINCGKAKGQTHRYCARNRSTVNEWGVKFR